MNLFKEPDFGIISFLYWFLYSSIFINIFFYLYYFLPSAWFVNDLKEDIWLFFNCDHWPTCIWNEHRARVKHSFISNGYPSSSWTTVNDRWELASIREEIPTGVFQLLKLAVWEDVTKDYLSDFKSKHNLWNLCPELRIKGSNL